MKIQSSKITGMIWIIAGTALAAAAVWGLPFIAKQVPWSYETALSKRVGTPEDFTMCPIENTTHADTLKDLVSRIYPIFPEDQTFPIEVQIVLKKQVNAFATLGGKVFVFSGLLDQAESPEEIAGVLAHEFEHVHHRHIVQGILSRLITSGSLAVIFSGGTVDPDAINNLLNLSFTRAQEADADRAALARLKKAEISSDGFIHFFKRLNTLGSIPAIISDHPSHKDRIEMAKASSGYTTRPILSETKWSDLKRACVAKF